MKLQLFALATTGSIMFAWWQGSPVPAVTAALSAIPIGYTFGTLDQKKRSPDVEAIRIRAAAEASQAAAANCEIRMADQRSRLASQANEILLQEIAKARAEATAVTAAQWRSHCEQIEATIATLKTELATAQTEAEKARRRYSASLATNADRCNAEAEAAADRHNAEIEKLNERLAKLEATATEYRRRENALKRGEERITEYRANEKAIRLEIKHQAAAAEGTKRTIATLQNELRSMQSAAIAQYNDGLKIGQANGQNAAAAAFKNDLERAALTISKLENQIATLETKLRGKADRDRFTSGLPELGDIVSVERKPLLLEGSQGSGKCLAIGNAMMAYSKSQPVIALCLDISEADDPSSSWRRLGVPCTGDPSAFIEFVEAVEANMRSRAHRNDRAEYDRQPLIFCIIDEASDAFDDCEKEQIEHLKARLSRLQNQGSKRGVYPIMATQDRQIQNMCVKQVKLLTTGSAKKHYRILLNDALRENASAEELERDPDLAKYLSAFDGKYVAAIEKQTGRGLQKIPIKHPSHFGLELGDTVPIRGVEVVPIATAPDWLPFSCRSAYSEFAPVQDAWCVPGATADPNSASTATRTAAEAMPDKDCADLSDVRSPAALALKHGLSEDDVIALLDAIDDGRSMTAAVTSIAPKSSSRNSKYQKARELFLSLKS
jgi:hypothetical protein